MSSIPQPDESDELGTQVDELVAGALVTPQAQHNVNGDKPPDATEDADKFRERLQDIAQAMAGTKGAVRSAWLDVLRAEFAQLPSDKWQDVISPLYDVFSPPEQKAQVDEFLDSLKDSKSALGYWRKHLHNVSEFLQRPPKEWIVSQVLGAQDFALWYGESGHGKTHNLLDFAYSCATGRQFAERFDVARPLTVAYCTGEGIGGLRDRLQAVSEYYGTEDVPFYLLTDVMQLFDAPDVVTPYGFAAAWRQLADEGRVPEQVDVLIIDTLHNATAGANENSAQDFGIVLHNLRFLRDTLGCAVVLAHHANKSGQSERGTTALRATMDAVVRCQKVGADGFTMSCEKLKDGEAWPAQAFSLTAKADSVRVFWEGDASQNAATATRENKIIAHLADNAGTHYTADEVAQAIDDEQRTSVQGTLRRLRDAGTVDAAKEAHVTKDSKTRDVWCYWIDILSQVK